MSSSTSIHSCTDHDILNSTMGAGTFGLVAGQINIPFAHYEVAQLLLKGKRCFSALPQPYLAVKPPPTT